MRGLLEGASYPLRAFRLLARQPELWRYVAIPVALNVAVGIALYAGLLVAGLRSIETLVQGLPEWAAVLGIVLRVLLVVWLFLLIGFVLARFGVVLGSPWYGILSERLEVMRTGMAPPAGPGGLAGVLRDLGRALRFEAQKLLLVICVTLLLLLLNLIPLAGPAAAGLGGIALGATIACLDFFDAPLERRFLSFRQKLGIVRRSLPASAGFGLLCFALSGVPLLNLFAIPLCVAAGTLFFCDRLTQHLPPASAEPARPAGPHGAVKPAGSVSYSS